MAETKANPYLTNPCFSDEMLISSAIQMFVHSAVAENANREYGQSGRHNVIRKQAQLMADAWLERMGWK